ncbi:hypothetical protein K438DRAFT_1971412 [Mycena galopus ATCC 62051]|nr:hypothetical protein K438DRAFT_1971412 [Mycena galopus ATCC 62051]
MKTTTIIICALSWVISAVDAAPRETNAQRFAHGLPPLPPKRRSSTSVSGAKRAIISSTPFSCAAQKPFCCALLESATIPAAVTTLNGLGVPQASAGAQIGVGCVATSTNSCFPGSSLAQCCGNLLGINLVGINCVSSDRGDGIHLVVFGRSCGRLRCRRACLGRAEDTCVVGIVLVGFQLPSSATSSAFHVNSSPFQASSLAVSASAFFGFVDASE